MSSIFTGLLSLFQECSAQRQTGKESVVVFVWSRVIWYWGYHEYTVSCVSVVKPVLDRQDIQLTPGGRSTTINICDWNIQISQLWQNSASTWGTTSSYITLAASPPNPHILDKLRPSNVIKEDEFCLSKAWKSLICSLTDCRKIPLQDFLDRFSTGPCRPGHAALIRAQTLLSLGAHQPWDFFPFLGFLHCSYSSYPHHMPTLSSLLCPPQSQLLSPKLQCLH
jgi:hypothetical protein